RLVLGRPSARIDHDRARAVLRAPQLCAADGPGFSRGGGQREGWQDDRAITTGRLMRLRIAPSGRTVRLDILMGTACSRRGDVGYSETRFAPSDSILGTATSRVWRLCRG